MMVGAKLVVLYVHRGATGGRPRRVRTFEPGSGISVGAGGGRGAPALGPRGGNFCRFETLEGCFLVKIEMLAL